MRAVPRAQTRLIDLIDGDRVAAVCTRGHTDVVPEPSDTVCVCTARRLWHLLADFERLDAFDVTHSTRLVTYTLLVETARVQPRHEE